MNLRAVLYLLGWLMISLGAALVVPAAVAYVHTERDFFSLIAAAGLSMFLGTIFVQSFRQPQGFEFGRTEAFTLVVTAWLVASLVGAVPWVIFYGSDFWVNALFESASGFTTTGASILTDIESEPKGLLLWRSLTQWLGGMGIIVLGIAVLPKLAKGGLELLSAEAPGPTAEKLTPRIAQTAKTLWVIYLSLTLLLALIFSFLGMGPFDAVNHALTTLSTGGFSTKNASMAGFQSPAMEWVTVVFMFLAGMNFALHFQALRGRFALISKDTELRVYALSVVGLTALILLDLSVSGRDWLESLRLGAFQVVSVMSTTGFCTDDFNLWPHFSRLALLMLMFVGGCAGSTSGSVKLVRHIVLFKKFRADLLHMSKPHAVVPIRIGDRVMHPDVVTSVTTFIALFVLISSVGAVALAATGLDIESALSASVSSLGNIGPGFGVVGAVENYNGLAPQSKLLLAVMMITGRLELYTVLALPFLLIRRLG